MWAVGCGASHKIRDACKVHCQVHVKWEDVGWWVGGLVGVVVWYEVLVANDGKLAANVTAVAGYRR